MSNRIFSPVAVDLGATHTGVSFFHADKPWHYDKANHIAKTYQVSTDTITFAQADRRAKRHQKRGVKRKRYANRLFFLILKEHFAIDFDNTKHQKEMDFIHHLLNRRGYTYMTSDDSEKQKELEDFILEHEHEITTKDFSEATKDISFLEVVQEKLTDEKQTVSFVETLEKTIETEKKEILKKNPKEKFSSKTGQKFYEKYPTLSVLQALQEYFTLLQEAAKESGAVHRTQYQKNIKSDLHDNKDFLQFLKKNKIEEDDFYRILCHVANLPLKPLRKYFTNIEYKAGDKWEPQRLHNILNKWVCSWHNKKPEETKNKTELLTSLAKEKNPIAFFLQTSEEVTIPPFEDQNNRRVPRCQSMLLSASQLDEFFPLWKNITKKILQNFSDEYSLAQDDKLLEQLKDYEKGQTPFHNKKGKDKRGLRTKEAIFLQRILDTNSQVDPLRLRLLNRYFIGKEEQKNYIVLSKKQKQIVKENEEKLSQMLSAQEMQELKKLLQTYYEEINEARGGLWMPQEQGKILIRCERKPRQKINEKASLLRNITKIEEGLEKDFEEFWRSEKVKGNLTLHGLARKMEEKRKEIGGGFKIYLESKEGKKETQALTKEFQIALTKIQAKIQESKFGTKVKIENFNNWFSFTQIYNILEAEKGGFYKTCHACSQENHWRMEEVATDKNNIARATRLSADSHNIFDGQLKMLLDRIALEIVNDKIKQLENTGFQIKNKNDTLEIPLLIEQNKFNFQHDLGTLKKNNKMKKKAEGKQKQETKHWQNKVQRIQKAGQEICPYTSKKIIQGRGQIDHIVSRHFSRGSHSTVFNSEMNLIYASVEGNLHKGQKRYFLSDLDTVYLKKNFPDCSKGNLLQNIEDRIKKKVNKILEEENIIVFESLPEEDQKDLRHALFSQDKVTQQKVQRLLLRSNQARVNGTQSYLAKRLKLELLQKLKYKFSLEESQVHIYAKFVDPKRNQESNYRNFLAVHYPYLEKDKVQQGFASHAIDACMFLAEHIDEKIAKFSKPDSKLLKSKKNILKILPQEFQVKTIEAKNKLRKKNIKGKSLMKEGMFAVRFLPFIITQETCGFGFHPNNMATLLLTAGEHFYNVMKPLLYFKDKNAEPKFSFAELQGKIDGRKRPYVYLPIHRQRALKLLHEWFHQQVNNPTLHEAAELSQEANKADKKKQEQVFYLQQLMYVTAKKNVQDAITESTNKKNISKKKLDAVSENNFLVKTEKIPSSWEYLKSFYKETSQEISSRSSVLLPFYESHWQKVIDHEAFQPMKEKGEIDLPTWKTIEQDVFHKNQPVADRHHQKVRKVYSLPEKSTPSGGIYVKRKTFDKQDVFQLHSVNDSLYGGFFANEEKIHFNKAVPLPLFSQSKNVFLKEVPLSSKNMVQMDETRMVNLKEALEEKVDWLKAMWITPTSNARRSLEITIGMQKFLDEIAPHIENLPKKLDDKVFYNIAGGLIKPKNLKSIQLFSQIGAEPRDSIQILAVSYKEQSVNFAFSVGTNRNGDKEKRIFKDKASLEQLYNQSDIYR